MKKMHFEKWYSRRKTDKMFTNIWYNFLLVVYTWFESRKWQIKDS